MKGLVNQDMTITVDNKNILLETLDSSKIGVEVDFIIVTDDVTDYARIVDHIDFISIPSDEVYSIPKKILIKLIESSYQEGYNTYEIVEAGLESFDKSSFANWKINDLIKYKHGYTN